MRFSRIASSRSLALLCAGLLVLCCSFLMPRIASCEDVEAVYQRSLQLLESPKNKELLEGFRLCQKCAYHGHVEAQYKLGCIYRDGDVSNPNYPRAAEFFEMAADRGHAEAQYALGQMYEKGTLPRSYLKAAGWYSKAARNGHVGAQLALGALYHHGRGLLQNYGKAREWYEKAAAAGNADAMNDLGVLYDNGLGVRKDYGKAVELFRKAAEGGSSIGMSNLGLKYQFGQGVEKDYDKAIACYEKAAGMGNRKALGRLENAWAAKAEEARRVADEERQRKERLAREERERQEKIAREERNRERKLALEERERQRQWHIENSVPPIPFGNGQLSVSSGERESGYVRILFLHMTCKVDEMTIYDIVVNRDNMEIDGRKLLPVTLRYGQVLERIVRGQGVIQEVKVLSDKGIGVYSWEK